MRCWSVLRWRVRTLLSNSPRRQSHLLGRYHPLLLSGLAALEQRFDIARDESRARLIAQIDPRPPRHNHEPITRHDQIEMWMNSQAIQATKPPSLRRPISATAAPRPIVASVPLSM